MQNKKLRLFGGELEIIADEIETLGHFDLFNNTIKPGTEVPLHMHTRYSETFYLTEGKLTVFLKGKTIELNPGDHIVIPVNTPHALINAANEACRGTLVTSPSGFARLVKTAGVPIDSGANVNMEIFKKVSEELGDVLLGPPGSRP